MEKAPTLSAPDITASLRMILRALLASLGAWRVQPEMALLVHRRISATFDRIERLLTRFRAGRLWRMTQRAPGRRGRVKAGRAPALPRRFGWLVQAGGHQAAGLGAQLQAVLNTQEMGELLAASAQAGRILQPLCRALAVDLPTMPTPARRVTATRRIRTLHPKPKPEPFKIPLPRGVLSWARREGYGKLC